MSKVRILKILEKLWLKLLFNIFCIFQSMKYLLYFFKDRDNPALGCISTQCLQCHVQRCRERMPGLCKEIEWIVSILFNTGINDVSGTFTFHYMSIDIWRTLLLIIDNFLPSRSKSYYFKSCCERPESIYKKEPRKRICCDFGPKFVWKNETQGK